MKSWQTAHTLEGRSPGAFTPTATSPIKRPDSAVKLNTASSSTSSSSTHSSLHRRATSNNSLSTAAMSAAPTFKSPFTGGYIASQNRIPEPSSYRMKSHLRRLSTKEDQGGLDLSRSAADNEFVIGGLGISDLNLAGRPASERAFLSSRRGSYTAPSHAHSTGGNSLASDLSFNFKQTTSFVHPMHRSPQPYMPPSARPALRKSSAESEELGDGVRDVESWKLTRAPSISSLTNRNSINGLPSTENPRNSLTKLNTVSQSNLSLKSTKSFTSLTSPTRQPRQRYDTHKSVDLSTSAMSRRTSFDLAFGFAGRPESGTTDPAARRASIRAARVAFEEKEAAKELKYEQEEMKRKEREGRRRSDANIRPPVLNRHSSQLRDSPVEGPFFGGKDYISQVSEDAIVSPSSEEDEQEQESDDESAAAAMEQSSGSPKKSKSRHLIRFATWSKTRLLSVK